MEVIPASECPIDVNKVTCTFDTIPGGEKRIILIRVRVGDGALENTVFGNVAVLNAAENPTDFSEISRPIVSTTELKVSKDSPPVVGDGVSFDYTITLKNSGPNDAENVILGDPPTDDFVITEVSDSRCEIGGDFAFPGDLQCRFGVLPSGDEVTFKLRAIAKLPDSLPYHWEHPLLQARWYF